MESHEARGEREHSTVGERAMKRLVATGRPGWKVTVDLELIVRLNAEILAQQAEIADLRAVVAEYTAALQRGEK